MTLWGCITLSHVIRSEGRYGGPTDLQKGGGRLVISIVNNL